MCKDKKDNIIKKGITTIGLYFLVFLTTIILFYCFNSFWNWNIEVPITPVWADLISDGGTLTLAQKAIKGEGILSVQGFWTVDDAKIAWRLMDGHVHFLIMRLLAIFIQKPGELANVYYIFTYALCGSMMFYVLRRFKIEIPIAYVISVLYAFLPGHWGRNIGHLAIGSCFALPLMILGCVYIIVNDDESLQGKMIMHGQIKINRYVIEGMVGSLLVGFSSLYFCVFSMICHFFSGLIASLNRNKKARYTILFLVVDFLTVFFIAFLPNIFNNTAISSLGTTRYVSDIDVYSMKIPQLILPIANHRIPFLSELRMKYSMSFIENENGFSSLGLFLSIGLIFSLVIILKENLINNKMKVIKQIGKLNLLIIIVSVIGGLGELIGLFFGYLRSYNRMSFIIAVLSAITMALLLSMFLNGKKQGWKWLISIIIMVVFLLDETPTGAMIDIDNSIAYEETWNNEKKFFGILDDAEIQNVLIFPSKFSDLYNETQEAKCELMKPYIYTNNIKFTTGYLENSPTDHWIKALEEFDDKEKIKICAGIGFDGILLYKDGFATEETFYETYKGFLEILGDENLMISEDGQWYYFSILDEKEKIVMDGFQPQEVQEECRKIIEMPTEMEFSKKYTFGADEIEPYIIEGLGDSETTQRWSVGEKSIIAFSVGKEAFGDIEVQLRYCALYGGNQDLVICINDQFLKEVELTENSGTVEFTIPREMMEEGYVTMEIQYSNPVSPASERVSGDTRELAVAWESMILKDTGKHTAYITSYYSEEFLNYLGR